MRVCVRACACVCIVRACCVGVGKARSDEAGASVLPPSRRRTPALASAQVCPRLCPWHLHAVKHQGVCVRVRVRVCVCVTGGHERPCAQGSEAAPPMCSTWWGVQMVGGPDGAVMGHCQARMGAGGSNPARQQGRRAPLAALPCGIEVPVSLGFQERTLACSAASAGRGPACKRGGAAACTGWRRGAGHAHACMHTYNTCNTLTRTTRFVQAPPPIIHPPIHPFIHPPIHPSTHPSISQTRMVAAATQASGMTT